MNIEEKIAEINSTIYFFKEISTYEIRNIRTF